MAGSYEPTERERFWLTHEAALVASGLTAKAYAGKEGLSLHAFYQARKRLRAVGLLPAGEARRVSRRSAAKPEFSKVELVGARRAPLEYRLSLPNGLVLEWSGGTLPEAVVDLVERLAPAR